MDNGVTVDFWRQLDFVAPADLEFPITVIGAGGIGSPATLCLAKMGCSDITVYDFDTLEAHNLPNQFYRLGDVGRPKVEALAEVVKDFTGISIKPRVEKFVDQSLSGVVVVGVDNMDARKDIWQRARFNVGVPLYIDARMGGEVGLVYVINPTTPSDMKFYESTLYSSEEAAQIACTARAISYNVFVLAGVIASLVKKFAKREELPVDGKKEIPVDLVNLTLL